MNDSIADENKYLSLKNASQIYGYTRDHLGLMIRQGKLNGLKLGSYYVTTNEWMADYIQKYASPAHPAIKNKLSNKFLTKAFSIKDNTIFASANLTNNIAKKTKINANKVKTQNISDKAFSDFQRDLLSSLHDLSTVNDKTISHAVFETRYAVSENPYVILPVRKMKESEREEILNKTVNCDGSTGGEAAGQQ